MPSEFKPTPPPVSTAPAANRPVARNKPPSPALLSLAGLRPLALIALTLWMLILGIVAIRLCRQPTRNSVYPLFVATGEKWCRGANVYIPVGDYRYSPAVAAGFSVLSRLPPAWGTMMWASFNIVLFFFGFLCWARCALPGRRDQDFCAVLLLLATPMMIGNFNNLQANPAVFGCMLGATAAVVTRRFTLAAVLLALAIYLKLYPLALALVFLVLYPRQLSWRLALALLVGAALPFAFQSPDYAAHSYVQWLDNLQADQRNDIKVKDAYRDLALLWRVWGDLLYLGLQKLLHLISGHPRQIDYATTFNQQVYTLLQLAGAAAIGGVALRVRRLTGALTTPRREHLLLTLVIVWLMVLGPSSESATYTMLAPIATWFFLHAIIAYMEARKLQTNASRTSANALLLPTLAYGCLLVAAVGATTPYGKTLLTWGPQPLAALLTFIVILHWYREGGIQSEPRP